MSPKTVGELIATLQGYVKAGELHDDSLVSTILWSPIRHGRSVKVLGEFKSPAIQIHVSENGERKLQLVLSEPGLSRKVL